MHDPRLHRTSAISADLRALGVTDPAAQHPPLPATEAYVARIRAASSVRFIAHHYTRYLGDLAGGQVIGKMMAQHYGATEDQLGFSRFPEIGKPVLFRRGYRDALDALDLNEADEDDLVAEARWCFGANTALFDALAHLSAQAH